MDNKHAFQTGTRKALSAEVTGAGAALQPRAGLGTPKLE